MLVIRSLLADQESLESAAIDAFVEEHGSPIVEGTSVTFVFRGDVRDHVSNLDISDFGLGLEDVIAGDGSGTVHNIELSVGIGVIF